MAVLETIESETGPNPVATIIVLHGLGADGNDFVPIAQELDLSELGNVRFVFPHAPVIPVTINNGYRMRAWYDILGMDLVRREDDAGLRRASCRGPEHLRAHVHADRQCGRGRLCEHESRTASDLQDAFAGREPREGE